MLKREAFRHRRHIRQKSFLQTSWIPEKWKPSRSSSSRLRLPRRQNRQRHKSGGGRSSSSLGLSYLQICFSRRRYAKVREPCLEVAESARKRCDRALDCHPCRLECICLGIRRDLATNNKWWTKRLQTWMQSHMLDALGPVSVISFWFASTPACNTSEMHEGLSMSKFHFFMKGSCATALNVTQFLKRTSSSNMRIAKEGEIRTYTAVLSFLYETYVAIEVEVGVETDDTLPRYNEHLAVSPTQFAGALAPK